MISADYGDAWCCENCGLPITTLCEIEDEMGKRFIVGSDCAESLISKDNEYSWEWLQAKEALKPATQTARYIAKLRKAKRENKLKITESQYFIYDKPLDDPKTIWSLSFQRDSKVIKLYEKLST